MQIIGKNVYNYAKTYSDNENQINFRLFSLQKQKINITCNECHII